MGDQNLTDLCGICFTASSKYRCPRCQARTCSLPCYQRHQKRASCNGRRDPTAFVKKSQWATPAGIDRDYNFLKGIERSIEAARRSTSDHDGGVDQTSQTRSVARSWREGSRLQQYLQTQNITVQHAPKGMTRQKTNQTRSSNQGKVFWTVEWIDDEGRKVVDHQNAESSSIQDLHSAMHTRVMNAATREADAQAHSRKRKRKNAAESPSSELEDQQPLPSHFYLLNPGTASSGRLVTSLDPAASLTASLAGRLVQEYPTIFALTCDPQSLPKPFLLETENRSAQQRGADPRDISRNSELENKPWPKTDANIATDLVHEDEQELDQSTILDMLKRH